MRHLTRIATTILAAFLAVGLPYGAGAGSRHQQDTPLVVVLDPGHGGQDIGAADATQTLVEKTLTLQVARLTATTAVATLSRRALEAGARKCMLLADLANPTANHIYASIGYRRRGDWEEHRLK